MNKLTFPVQFFILFLFQIIHFQSLAQDPQLSLIYSNPLFLNPARAGYEQSLDENNCGIIFRSGHRNQWPQIESNFKTYTLSVDGYDLDTRFGIGLAIMDDNEGDFINKKNIKGVLAYHWPINAKGDIAHFGIDINKSWLNYNAGATIFMDQLTGAGVSTNSNDPLSKGNFSTSFLDFSTGAILELRPETYKLIFIGLAARNLFKPNFNVYSTAAKPSDVFYGLELGYQKSFRKGMKLGLGHEIDRFESISANAYLKAQGQSMQLDIGLTYNLNQPIILGINYRGIPIKREKNSIQQDALITMLGFDYGRIGLRYAYDINISSLYNTGGSHEVVLKLRIGNCLDTKILKNRDKRRKVNCISFQQ